MNFSELVKEKNRKRVEHQKVVLERFRKRDEMSEEKQESSARTDASLFMMLSRKKFYITPDEVDEPLLQDMRQNLEKFNETFVKVRKQIDERKRNNTSN